MDQKGRRVKRRHLRRELEHTRLELEEARNNVITLALCCDELTDLAAEFYDALKKWGLREPVLERYRLLMGRTEETVGT